MSELPLLDGPMSLPASGAARSMVIFLHGYGSNGADLMGLVPPWRGALPDTVFLAPNAPTRCPDAPGGYQWWGFADPSPQGRAAKVRQPAPALDAFIDAQLAHYGLAAEQLALVGFSQGTMLALHAGPRRARTLAGIVGYSGMLTDPDELAAEVRTRPPVLLVHGAADPMIPVSALHQAEAGLAALGFEVATHVSPGLGHSIDEAGLRLGGAFLARRLG